MVEILNPYEPNFYIDFEAFRRQLDEQKERDKDFKWPFRIIGDESVPRDTMMMYPSHLNLTLVGGKLKVKETVHLHGRGIVYYYRDLNEDERRQFAMVKM